MTTSAQAPDTSRMNAEGRGLAIGSRIAAVVIAAAFLAAGCSGSASASDPTTVAADALPVGIVEHYRYIDRHRSLAEQVPCYCGCGPTLSHRNLRDCFVRDDGRLVAHAKGCGVCLAEAAAVGRMEAAGMNAAAISAAITEQFSTSGPPTRG